MSQAARSEARAACNLVPLSRKPEFRVGFQPTHHEPATGALGGCLAAVACHMPSRALAAKRLMVAYLRRQHPRKVQAHLLAATPPLPADSLNKLRAQEATQLPGAPSCPLTAAWLQWTAKAENCTSGRQTLPAGSLHCLLLQSTSPALGKLPGCRPICLQQHCLCLLLHSSSSQSQKAAWSQVHLLAESLPLPSAPGTVRCQPG